MSIYDQFRDVYLCTHDQFKMHRYGGGASESYDTDDDNTIDFYIREASRIITDSVLHQLPLPYIDTLTFDAPHGERQYIDEAYVLNTSDAAPLLAVTTLTNGDGTTISASDFVLYPANSYPKNLIRIKSSASDTFTYTTTWEQAISVAGVWGYVPHYDNAWQDSTKDLPAGGITDSATSFTFSTAADAATFSVGDYIQLESEWCLVTASDSSTGAVTIQRAQLGSTAAAHSAGVDIDTFVQHQQIMSACAKLASAMYNKDRAIYDDITPTPAEAIDVARGMLFAHARLNVI